MELTSERANQILDSRLIVSQPCKLHVKVTGVSTYENSKFKRKELANGIAQMGVANLQAMNLYQSDKADALLADGLYQDAVNQQLKISLLEGKYIPSVGEIITVCFDYVETKEKVNESTGEIIPAGKALLATSYYEVPVGTTVTRKNRHSIVSEARPTVELFENEGVKTVETTF